jgi:hypothetical protein
LKRKQQTKGETKKKKQTHNQNTRFSNSLSQEKKRKTNCLSTNKKFQFFSQQKLVNTFSYALERLVAIRCTQSDDGVPRTPTLSPPQVHAEAANDDEANKARKGLGYVSRAARYTQYSSGVK